MEHFFYSTKKLVNVMKSNLLYTKMGQCDVIKFVIFIGETNTYWPSETIGGGEEFAI